VLRLRNPDSENSRITRLQNRNRELRTKLQALTEYYDAEIATVGGMKQVTFNAMVRVLHPDRTPTLAERQEACGLFIQWKQDRDKATKRK
jgi:hypothetical protein